MITLPHIATKASVKTDAEPSVSTDLAAGEDALPKDFLTALGNQLLGLAKQHGKVAQSADAKAEKTDDARPKAPLNALMAALDNYQDEYRNKLNDDMSSGIASTRWTNYHQFIQTLEKAIEQHRNQLNNWNQRLEQALINWRDKQQRLNAYQTLITRAAENALRQENRLDQKRMDEFAQRAASRRGE